MVGLILLGILAFVVYKVWKKQKENGDLGYAGNNYNNPPAGGMNYRGSKPNAFRRPTVSGTNVSSTGFTCDQCGASARWKAVKKPSDDEITVEAMTNSSSSLFFCGHHYDKNEDGLVKSGFEVEKVA